MSIAITCDGCGRRLHVADSSAGKSVDCPKCGFPNPIPGDEGATLDYDAPPPMPKEKPAGGRTPLSSGERTWSSGGRSAPKPQSSNTAAQTAGGLIAAVVVGVICFFIFRGANQQVGNDDGGPANWQAFTPPDGRFTVQMPSETFTMTQPLEIEGVKVDMTVVRSNMPDRSGICMIMHNELPAEARAIPAKNIIEEVRANAVEGFPNARVTREVPVRSGNFEGKEVSIQIQMGTIHVRYFVADDRLYQVMMSPMAGKSPKQEDINRFFNSFQVNAAAKPAVKPEPGRNPIRKPFEFPKLPEPPKFKVPEFPKVPGA